MTEHAAPIRIVGRVLPELCRGPFIASTLGLWVDPEDIPDDPDSYWILCEDYAKTLSHLLGGIHWILGDYLNAMEFRWGESYAQLEEVTGFARQTLYNDKYVASRIPKDLRTHEEPMTFGHYQALASLDPSEIELWVQRVLDESLTRVELRDLLGEKAPQSTKVPQSTETWDNETEAALREVAESALALEPGVEPTFANRVKVIRLALVGLMDAAPTPEDRESLRLAIDVLEDVLEAQEV